MDRITFKERVAQTAIAQAPLYKHNFVDYEYLLCSDAFQARDYYILSAQKDNYRHLIGVNTSISANDFFERCMDGTLTEGDFDFKKPNRSEREIKGSVRRKIKALPLFISMFGKPLVAQEKYTKSGIACAFATTDCNITLGVVEVGKSRPKSLLWGDLLDWNKADFVDLILRRKSGEALFSEMVFGDDLAVKKYFEKIESLVSQEIIDLANRSTLAFI